MVPTNQTNHSYRKFSLTKGLFRYSTPESRSSYIVGGGGGVNDELPTFDAEFISSKIPKSLYDGGWEVQIC